MTTRIYSVQSANDFHLVEATTKNAALRHIAEKHFEVSVADQKTLVGAIQDGVKIEKVGEIAQSEPAAQADANKAE
jgi:hypothetical protein